MFSIFIYVYLFLIIKIIELSETFKMLSPVIILLKSDQNGSVYDTRSEL